VDHVFSLTSGVDQGDLVASLLFLLTLHAFLFKVHNIIPSLQLNAWYLNVGGMFASPIGPDQNVQDFMKAKIENIQSILDRISYINNPQTEMIILRSSANSSKINHLLRTVRRDHIRDKLQIVN
jgi:hypothetical protein